MSVESGRAAGTEALIVTPVGAEAHFARDLDSIVRDAGEVERRKVQMPREFGANVDAAGHGGWDVV